MQNRSYYQHQTVHFLADNYCNKNFSWGLYEYQIKQQHVICELCKDSNIFYLYNNLTKYSYLSVYNRYPCIHNAICWIHIRRDYVNAFSLSESQNESFLQDGRRGDASRIVQHVTPTGRASTGGSFWIRYGSI